MTFVRVSLVNGIREKFYDNKANKSKEMLHVIKCKKVMAIKQKNNISIQHCRAVK